MRYSATIVAIAVAIAIPALGCKKQSADDPSVSTVPAWFPIPEGGTFDSSMKLGDSDSVVYLYPSREVDEVAKELRGKLADAGLPVEDGPGSQPQKQFISATLGDINVSATVFMLEHTTLTLVVDKVVATRPQPPAASSGVPRADVRQVGPPTGPAPANYPPSFPYLTGGEVPLDQPDKLPSEQSIIAVIYPGPPSATLGALRRVATDAGWSCDDGPGDMMCSSRSTTTHARVFDDPKTRGTVLILSVP
jgi:hypothetical protein